MTDLDKLLEAGLTLEEATLILARRAVPKPTAGSKLTQALKALADAQKKVGVHPVVVEGGWIEKAHDPEAEEGFLSFYAKKTDRPKRRLGVPPPAVEDESQDPKDY